MKLIDTMICWCSQERWDDFRNFALRDGTLPDDEPRIIAVDKRDPRQIERANYLPSSLLAKGGNWIEVSDDQRVCQLFILFNELVTMNGLSVDEVHNAFLAIDEYRDYHNPEIWRREGIVGDAWYRDKSDEAS